jgi:AcrR family transcriptional regulator
VTDDQPADSRRRRSPRGQGGRVRNELVAVAERLLEARGSADEITVAEIVGGVGVTPPVLYAHFADKQALFVAVHERRMKSFRDALRRAGGAVADPLLALERRGRAYVRFATKHPDAYRALFMSREANTESSLRSTDPSELTAFDDLVGNIQQCIDHALIPPGDAALLATVVWAQVHGLSALLIAMPEVADDVGVAAITDATLGAVVAGLLNRHPEGE